MRSPIAAVLAALSALAGTLPAQAADVAPAVQPVASMAAEETKPLSAKEAGARYGEAAGAALVCYGLKITQQVAELRAHYQGADLVEFDAQAGKILQAWRSTLTCEQADGPNDCKVSQQWSCKQAVDEIGPSGTAVRGLVVPKE